jgi:hypothetical protein
MTTKQRDESSDEKESQPQSSQSPSAASVLYKGTPPYGTEFLTEHRLTKRDIEGVLVAQGMDPEAAKEEAKGFSDVIFHRGNGFRVSAGELHPEALAYLDRDPSFKVERG